MKKFIVYLDDGIDCYKVAVPAENKNDALNFCAGNGEIIAVKDVTEEFPISLDSVRKALERAEFGAIETDLIMRTLSRCNIAE